MGLTLSMYWGTPSEEEDEWERNPVKCISVNSKGERCVNDASKNKEYCYLCDPF